MYFMPNILYFLGGKCFYFSRSVLGTFCEEEFVFEFEVLSFKFHFFQRIIFFDIKSTGTVPARHIHIHTSFRRNKKEKVNQRINKEKIILQ